VDIVGPVCESGDFLAKDIQIRKLQQNDFIALASAGAYGQALASNYNLRPRIAEYLVDSSDIETIAAAESVDDLINRFNC